jgi:uncharacterized protein YgiM (DUF1202 family)
MKSKFLKAFISAISFAGALTFANGGIATPQKVSAATMYAPVSVYEVNVGKLNVRSAPTANSKVVDTLRKDDQIEIVKFYNGSWAQINTTTTKNGIAYVSTKYLTKLPSVVTTKSDLNLRTGPSKKYQVITVIPKGAKVSFLGYHKNSNSTNDFYWAVVSYKGHKGYASTTYLNLK